MTKNYSTDIFLDNRLKNLAQEYSAYTAEDFKVWKILFERQYKNLPGAASRVYLNGLNKIGFRADKIADFSDANQRLAETTGWRIVVVPGLIDVDLFFGLLSKKCFPSSTWLRKLHELDYLQEPDMFHDAFAHLPMLTDKSYTRFLQELAEIAMRNMDNPLAIDLLSRIYWFTIEFGLIRENGHLRVYGAGILSSSGETKFCLSDEPQHLDYNVEIILNTPYWKNKFQVRYFIVNSFEELYQSIPEIEEKLAILLEKSEKED